MSKKSLLILSIFIVLAGIAFVGCKTLDGDVKAEQNPTVILFPSADSIIVSSAPLLYWRGLDRDGEVYTYEFVDIIRSELDDDDSYYGYYSDPSTMPDMFTYGDITLNWTETEKDRDTIFFSLEEGDTMTEHLFCVRGIDSQERKSDPDCYIWFRKNQPPDSLKITTEMFDDEHEDYVYDTLWCLKELTDSWHGINISWMATDPDNSIILEYYWYLEDRNSGSHILTSKSVDSTDTEYDSTGAIIATGPYSGDNPYDGWLRDNIHVTLYDIPTGDYRFIVKVRDDAFAESIADTAEMTLVKPLFDISDSTINLDMIEGRFEHNVLIVDETDDGPSMGVPEGNDFSRDFYSAIYEELVSNDVVNSYEFFEMPNIGGPPIWSLTKHQLAEYSIIHWFDSEVFTFNKAQDEIFEALKDYISVGGSVLMEGRNVFYNQPPGTSADDFMSETHFGLVSQSSGTFNYAAGSYVLELDNTEYTFPDLSVNSVVQEELGRDPNSISDVLGCTTQENNPFGLPAATPIYFFRDNVDVDSDANNRPCALLYKTRNFRTAFFSFPLMLMDNSDDQITITIENTMDFLTTRFPVDVVPPDSTQQ